MGNSSSSAFQAGDAIPYLGNSHWELNQGIRKEDKEEIAFFRYLKTQKDRLLPAQRATQKMKTLRHPHILSYVESAEYDDSLILVTEGCTPLEVWLRNISDSKEKSNYQDPETLHQELLWGFKCVLEALQFLHNNGFVHSYLGLHAIFVTKSGDWKIGALDLVGNMTITEDFNFLTTYAKLLASPYIAPERQTSLVFVSDAEKSSKVAVGSGADIFSLAHCIQCAFDIPKLIVPEGLSKYFSRMLSVDPKRRPTASQLAKCPVFNSENIKLMASLGDLAALKPANETLEALGQLSEKVAMLPVSICIHKILPSLARTLQMACTDFSNRDSRESCRQSIQLCLSILSRLADHKKIEEEHYCKQCVSSVLSLWTMTDRTIRTALLGSLKSMVVLTPADMVNKSIFDPLLAGFADSNAKMREETLKCLVHVVDKLDEKHLQEKLVRCIVNLQKDSENSIRTNATIFLGRIARTLKEGVRARVLCAAYANAMRDGFVHCRVAGLKAATASLMYLDVPQVSSKLLPQVCCLLTDKSPEVRELAIKLLELGLTRMKAYHKVTRDQANEAAAAALAAGESPQKGSATQEKESSSWAPSWSSLSMTLEKIAVGGGAASTRVSTGLGASSTAIATSDISPSSGPIEKKEDTVVSNSPVPAVKATKGKGTGGGGTESVVQKMVTAEGWGNDDGFDDWDDSNNSSSNNGGVGSSNSPHLDMDQDEDSGGGGWGGDDDLDLGDMDGEDQDNSSAANKTSGINSLTNSSKVPTSIGQKAAPLAGKVKKTPVSAGPSMKLEMGPSSGDNWDDF